MPVVTSCVITAEPVNVNILFTGSILEHKSKTLGAHAKKCCMYVCLANLGYYFLIYQGTKSLARIGPEALLKKIEFVTFLFSMQKEWKTWIRFSTCDLQKRTLGVCFYSISGFNLMTQVFDVQLCSWLLIPGLIGVVTWWQVWVLHKLLNKQKGKTINTNLWHSKLSWNYFLQAVLRDRHT